MFTADDLFVELDKISHLFNRDISNDLLEIYYDYLVSKLPLEKLRMAVKQAVIQGKYNPSPQWLAEIVGYTPLENRQAYKAIDSGKALAALPYRVEAEPVEVDPKKLDGAYSNRLIVLAAIYKHQGDSQFYQKMLGGREGTYSKVLDAVTASTISSIKVGHADVLTFLGVNEAATTNTSATASESTDYGDDY